MPLREIITIPHETLKRKARPVTSVDSKLQELIDDMVETMRAAPGVGLAAPQIDVPLSLIVVEFGDEEDEEAPKKLFTLLNPEITRPSTEILTGMEGCLSIPGFVADVDRHDSVVVKALNRRGQPVKVKASGWLARIFQHEVDHVNGILMTDIATKIYRLEDLEDDEEHNTDEDL
ncbi:MAG: peptide deformylase [Anaerolineae bacterium]|nr:MAG: peptide deformylase [Anaerolineae bacterium]